MLQAPKDESVNGVLVGYRLYYRELQYDSSPQEPKKAVNSSSTRTDLAGRIKRTEV